MNLLLERIQTSLLDLVGQFIQLLPGIAIALVLVLLTGYAAKVTQKMVGKMTKRLVPSRSLQLLAVQVTRIGTWAVGLIIAAVIAFPDLRLGDIIGLLGLGSVAIGFAFQDIFKNFLAGILLLLEEPFRLGDQVIMCDYEGTVEAIKIRSTQLRTYTGELVEIPNAIVFTNPVRVLTAFRSRRTDLGIGVDYTTPLPLAKQTFLEVINRADGVLSDPAPEVDVVGFGDSSIDFKLRYWTTPQMAEVRRIQTQLAMALKAACDEAGISIPYPIRTVHLFDQTQFSESKLLDTGDSVGQ
ncbi:MULTISPECIES: mechanosensitive ion channel family protein [Cyanophyceae]|uniref:mechanosensitive ion channel family protein n=1 Tax=Cyanophyceae TaxID=3028117 RepID=UPI00168530D6|nr:MULTISPECIES: mechanosensitive ion channel family protein [Cyanophyceae]MBD1917873.1 mechanosensitive ion channel family protein [Phormidium sp. FACHB-77]MBD2029713.1 mechanosensitive ion channel family protein [Phormidium sp. FACHB-322]MBD2052530.1 mechanosensitive ion channel family protein [Leptolyngbya sp. FACHB-60]